MHGELTRLIHSTIIQNELPARDLAEKIGKPYSTLLREVNPHDSGAKLGVETFMDIIMATGDITPVRYMAEQLGLELVRKDQHSAS